MSLFKHVILSATVLASVGFLTSCAEKIKYQTVEYSAIEATVKRDVAYKALVAALVETGFDIKMSDQEIGLLTTEWKQFEAPEAIKAKDDMEAMAAFFNAFNNNRRRPDARYDQFIQLKFKVSEVNGKIQIKSLPLIKSVNRYNANVFTERPLAYDPKVKAYIDQNPGDYLSPEYAYMNEMKLYQLILGSVSEYMGIDVANFAHSPHPTLIVTGNQNK